MAHTPKNFQALIDENIAQGKKIKALEEENAHLKAATAKSKPVKKTQGKETQDAE